ncbi:methylated-DNA--[protein]-cysteine S-methyltransferase [Microbacterium sp. No. 7]|uniref:methylated-DNA--[protein]-cysteine S-methyltransferase n=1 Tax=Microbacterium sp. No. 7 TaxID=1714373 RepID=UPI0006D00B48|nr:methylated-DNA--[protein]-cysteine S-methyltransferase [Microbacterium sp. No. 7]ALJ19688.1 cysteine methyltransferase [Microbacterium sp. No. 7]
MTSAPAAPRYAVHPTPLGDAFLVVGAHGLMRLTMLDAPLEHVLTDTGVDLRAVPVHDPSAVADVAAQLDEYFAGDRRDFDVPIDWSFARGFALAALQAVCTVPYGETASYAEIAALAGSGRAHRAVGTACAHTPVSIVLPAHRIVRADGSIGEYGGHPERKRYLLDLEAGMAPGRSPGPFPVVDGSRPSRGQ